MPGKARKRRMRDESRYLPADEKDSGENGDDPRPLPARHVFPEEDGREPDGDRSVERTKDADHRNRLHFHSEITEDKGAGIERAQPHSHPPTLAAPKMQG